MTNFTMQNVQLLIIIMYIITLIINTFNWNIKSAVMEMGVIEIFCSYYVKKNEKVAFFSSETFITTVQCNL